jgi:hypothetical protein
MPESNVLHPMPESNVLHPMPESNGLHPMPESNGLHPCPRRHRVEHAVENRAPPYGAGTAIQVVPLSGDTYAVGLSSADSLSWFHPADATSQPPVR